MWFQLKPLGGPLQGVSRVGKGTSVSLLVSRTRNQMHFWLPGSKGGGWYIRGVGCALSVTSELLGILRTGGVDSRI